MVRITLLIAVVSCGAPPRGASSPPAWIDDVSLSVRGPAPAVAPASRVVTVADTYRSVARKIIAAARADDAAFEKLRHLTDRIGHRLAGSKQLDLAIAWAAKTMKDEGHDVRTEDVMVPHWVRGAESAELVTPRARPIRVLALGGSVATPKGGLTAPVVVVNSWDDLAARGAEVKGAVVVYDVAMPEWSYEHGSGYGTVVQYRHAGASRAAKLGAVAVLMRSVTANSLGTLHTGAMGYEDGVPKIPAAAITVEDSRYLARLAAAGEKVTVKLRLESRVLPDAKSANVIGELRGRELPDEIVVIAAHIDSWDVGQGAHDDGAGVVTMMQALTTLRKLGLTPRRTIRVVLYTNEENGLRGAKAYHAAHQAELGKHVAALEADSGGFAPVAIGVDGKDAATRDRIAERVRGLLGVLAPVGRLTIEPGHTGADIDPLVKAGVPGLGLVTDGRRYFDYHHTEADTLDKVDPDELADCVATVAAFAYVVADLPARLDAPAGDPAFEPRAP
jgi:Zn-dependent M28 family amino/carboxypeptidase